MIDPKYAYGAIVMSKSLKQVKSKYPTCCMVTSDISEEYVKLLESEFDVVKHVPFISHDINKLKSIKQNQIYGKWIEKSFTKWNILNPNIFSFDKIILVDADMIFLENCDELFDLPAPSATFSSPWCKNYMKKSKIKRITNPYTKNGELNHGDLVPRNDILCGFNYSILCLACMILIEPNTLHYNTMLSILNQNARFGNPVTVSGHDEQLIVKTFLKLNINFHHIHQRYNWIAGKYLWLANGESPKTIQYYNEKPWNESREKTQWDDVREWYKKFDEIKSSNPLLQNLLA
jgi:lipopolysaccharide biosynthesis glycosyltransferase